MDRQSALARFYVPTAPADSWNSQAFLLNMPLEPDAPPDLDLYGPALQKWMPKAELRAPGKALARFDGVVTWKAPGGPFRYLVEEKRHSRRKTRPQHQDVRRRAGSRRSWRF